MKEGGEYNKKTDLKVLPVLLLPEDLDKDEISLIENIQRENLKASEEAKAYQRLIKTIILMKLYQILAKSRSYVTNLLRILDLDDFFLNLLNSGKISMGHAKTLVGKKPNDFDGIHFKSDYSPVKPQYVI